VGKHVVLLRGINVGDKNPLPMAKLRECLEELGYTNVATYINSGNVVLETSKSAAAIEREIEAVLPRKFKLHSELIKVLALPAATYRKMVASRPKGFGEKPDTYHSDAIFLMGGTRVKDAMSAFSPREGVDAVWPGTGVIFSQRLSAERTKSRLNKIMSTPFYKAMTIRNWATTTRLLEMLG
jgi:uncharacterized protein (DUF1697 family)